MAKVQLGIDLFLKEHLDLIKGKRIALLAHGASVDSTLTPTPQLLNQIPDTKLSHLFGPEHGLFGTEQDMESVNEITDPITGLHVVSLYGKTLDTLKPKAKDLAGFDILICDLQDIGSRYYTYIYTMSLCMKACAEAGKKVIVLDRPNPINGVDVQGNVLERKFASFVGLYPLPVRHGMTIGELAKYFNTEENIGCDLTVIPMKGWKRTMYYDETGLEFIPPSPNMPWLTTALVYPGMCLIEATILSEGRGTTMPFEWMGAPFIKAREFSEALNALQLPGVHFRPIYFKPNFQKWKGGECGGVQIHILDRKTLLPFEMGLYLIKTAIDLYPSKFRWRDRPYEFVSDVAPIDMLTGSSDFRQLVGDGNKLKKWIISWQIDIDVFMQKREKYLLY